MKTSDAFWQFLPEGQEELFEIVRLEKTEQSYDIWLDEKKKLSDEDYRNRNIVARGYTDYVTIQDYPMRGRPVYLHMRKNKWWDKSSNKREFGIMKAKLATSQRDMNHRAIRWGRLFF